MKNHLDKDRCDLVVMINKQQEELNNYKEFVDFCVDMADINGGADYCRIRSQAWMMKLAEYK